MYDKSKLVTYVFDTMDFGAAGGDEIKTFKLPPGYQGNLVQLGVALTETVAGAAVTVEIGTLADPDAYGLLTVPIAAADKAFYDQTDDTDAIMAVADGAESQIAAGDLIAIKTFGGSATAGIGNPVATFRVWK